MASHNKNKEAFNGVCGRKFVNETPNLLIKNLVMD